jgi:hypothetical protein
MLMWRAREADEMNAKQTLLADCLTQFCCTCYCYCFSLSMMQELDVAPTHADDKIEQTQLRCQIVPTPFCCCRSLQLLPDQPAAGARCCAHLS